MQLRFGKYQQRTHPSFPVAHTGGEGADLGGVQAGLEGVAIARLAAGFAFGF